MEIYFEENIWFGEPFTTNFNRLITCVGSNAD